MTSDEQQSEIWNQIKDLWIAIEQLTRGQRANTVLIEASMQIHNGQPGKAAALVAKAERINRAEPETEETTP